MGLTMPTIASRTFILVVFLIELAIFPLPSFSMFSNGPRSNTPREHSSMEEIDIVKGDRCREPEGSFRQTSFGGSIGTFVYGWASSGGFIY